MAEEQADSYQRRGATTGSPQRPAERLAGPALTFDLAAKLAHLRHDARWEHPDHHADTLVHEPDFRIVLIAMKPHARLQDHHAAARISVQALEGRLRLHLPDQTVDLAAGHMLALAPDIRHDVEALEESAFLLTIARPGGANTEA
jgi:quercetin dioxygenase-like cupin family protein